MSKIAPALVDKVEKLINTMGFELLGCELVTQKPVVFRIYIDNAKGVTADDCAKVSHQVSALLDVEDPVQSRYVLQVSSPGIDRPLFKMDHYRNQIGSRVSIKLYAPIDQRKHYKGILLRAEGENISLRVIDTGLEVTLPFAAIEKANVIGDIHFK